MKRLLTAFTVIFFILSCGVHDVTPEMKEFIGAFGSKDKMDVVVKKYAGSPGIIPEAIQACNLGKPNITKTVKKDKGVVYTVESVVERCEQSQSAIGTIRIFSIGWENGKIVSFEWLGPKGGKVEY